MAFFSSREYFRELGVDWFIHVDSDEFWYSPLQNNLKEYLKQVPDDVQCIKPELREYIPDSKNHFRVLMGDEEYHCLLYTSPSPRDQRGSRMPSSA